MAESPDTSNPPISHIPHPIKPLDLLRAMPSLGPTWTAAVYVVAAIVGFAMGWVT
jgi:hypothetical protein